MRGTSCGFVSPLIFSFLYFHMDAQDHKQRAPAELWGVTICRFLVDQTGFHIVNLSRFSRSHHVGFFQKFSTTVYKFCQIFQDNGRSVDIQDSGIWIWGIPRAALMFEMLVFSLFERETWCGFIFWCGSVGGWGCEVNSWEDESTLNRFKWIKLWFTVILWGFLDVELLNWAKNVLEICTNKQRNQMLRMRHTKHFKWVISKPWFHGWFLHMIGKGFTFFHHRISDQRPNFLTNVFSRSMNYLFFKCLHLLSYCFFSFREIWTRWSSFKNSKSIFTPVSNCSQSSEKGEKSHSTERCVKLRD